MSDNTAKIYFFGSTSDKIEEKNINNLEDLLGGKGAHLWQMSQQKDINVPPGIIIPTTECSFYQDSNNQIRENLKKSVIENIKRIEAETNKEFGNPNNPLLLSVRSGAKTSMPGMMDTILNLGMNEKISNGLTKLYGERFAFDCYRRFLHMYSNVVLEIPSYKIEAVISDTKLQFGILKDSELEGNHMRQICKKIEEKTEEISGKKISKDPYEQLFNAIGAVFDSCNSHRAQVYRKINNINQIPKTAVNIQSMVFGNLNDQSLTGVMFSRNPSNGNKEIYGEYILQAQGEDIVSGSRTPCALSKIDSNSYQADLYQNQSTKEGCKYLEEENPPLFNELKNVAIFLENYYKEMQDIEFTVEKGKLWILQARNGKRVVSANIKIQHDLVKEGIISKEEAISRIDPNSIDVLLHPYPKSEYKLPIVASGLLASPGVGIGRVVFTSDDAVKMTQEGNDVILVREETSPEDVQGMHSAKAILTKTGGMTSHAAVVCRGMGVPCVVGCEKIEIDYENKYFIAEDGKTKINEGDIISVDGFKGISVIGEIPMQKPELSQELKNILSWCDELSKVKVRANAETEKDCKSAIKFGAKGIGLARTEHMFFEKDALLEIRKAIIFTEEAKINESIQKITEIQTEMFVKLLEIVKDMPINIRLIDPPLHEFLPKTELEINSFLKEIQYNTPEQSILIKKQLNKIKESNPMLGLRGCRLGITMPNLYEAQVLSILEAIAFHQKNGIKCNTEIMIPFIQSEKELKYCIDIIKNVQEKVESKHNIKIQFKIGVMIELPRACIIADKLAPLVSYFSFGTNDLTQTTLGISRDDGESFISAYKDLGIVKQDPFVELDQEGVGELIKIALKNAKTSNKDIYSGICGEHGGNPNSIYFACEVGMSYVSCSPYRIPIARIATAQHAIQNYSKE